MNTNQYTRAETLRAITVAEAMVRLLAKSMNLIDLKSDLKLRAAQDHLNTAANLVEEVPV
jgi:hypothetical protein